MKVTILDAISYGFGLLGYIVALFLLSGVLVVGALAFGGNALLSGQPGGGNGGGFLIAVLLFLAAYAVLIAGFLGMQYKVAAEGAAHALEEMEREAGPRVIEGPRGGEERVDRGAP